MAEIAAVLQFEVEAGGVAQFLHRGRHEGEDLARRWIAHEGADGAAGRWPARVFLAPLRSLQSFSWMKAMPVFWPEPAKVKPATVKTKSTLSFSSSR